MWRNAPSKISHSARLDECPTAGETIKAVSRLQAGKAPGPDGTPPNILQTGGQVFLDGLKTYSNCVGKIGNCHYTLIQEQG